eukprot:10947619-Lingulodinium_polyedra.AAC.1
MDKPTLLYGTPVWIEQLKRSITRPKGPKTEATAKGEKSRVAKGKQSRSTRATANKPATWTKKNSKVTRNKQGLVDSQVYPANFGLAIARLQIP